MASKPKAPTRTTRTRTPTIPVPAPSRTTRAANTRATPTPPLTDPHAKKAPTRKPFVDRNASPEAKGRVGDIKQVKSTFTKPAANAYIPSDVDKEPIRAYLRIRPQMGDEDDTPHTNPYLEPISSTAVRMSDNSSTPRLSSPPAVYTFSHVFPPDTSQSDFFKHTTLPLVKDVLEGQSGLLFAYGVTNSGKTYTVQGGSREGSAGIIPRTLDVIFNSIEGLHGDGRFRPVRLQGIEAAPPTLSSSHSSTSSISSLLHEPVLLDLPPTDPDPTDTDPTAFKLDRNHEYTIWLSYAEVYNEKVYDLLASVDSSGDTSSSADRNSRPTSTFLTTPLNPSQSKQQHQQPLLLTRKALPVKPSPPSDSSFSFSDDSDSPISGGKYVAGQRQIRVTSAAQAKALLRVGQMHRQVFGTLANARSSRSHAVVTVKVLRVHKGERNDPTSIQTSRLTLVDLAGSERTRNTQTTGDRLREAGNINKSLMVLGQCMETMRANQRSIARRDARGLGFNGEDGGGRYDTREAKKSLAVVPFRHSKLTEVLMDYFVGEGRVVMIVNVNPYDTGYDENSHVMKFSAIAREVATLPPTATSRPVSTIPTQARTSKSSIGTRGSDGVVPHRRKVTISTGGPGVGETTLEVLEEDEEPGMEDEDDEPINPLVDALFDEIETLRMQLYESEMRSVIIEAQTREEVMTEMEERMKRMEGVYSRRLMQEIEQYEMKMDAKIEMLQRAGAGLASNPKPRTSLAEDSDETEEDDSEDEHQDSEDELEDEDDEDDDDDSYGSEERSSSPLAGKNAPRVNDKSSLSSRSIYSLSSNADTANDDENAEEAIPQSNIFQNQALPTPPNSQAFEEEEDSTPLPLHKAKTKARTKATTNAGRRSTRTTRTSSNSLAGVVQKTAALTLDEEEDDEDAAVIIPNRKARQDAVAHAGAGAEYVPQAGESDTGKKKKRQLSKKPVVTEADIERTIGGGDGAPQSSRPRRSTRTGRA